MILIIDNYDSFVYNLYQMVGDLYPEVQVVRNDAITLDEIAHLSPKAIIVSPGPGRPTDAGICLAVVKRFAGTVPLLGVCLGHQVICKAWGAQIGYAAQLMHGKQSRITTHLPSVLFAGLPDQFKVGRYHSLAAVKSTLPCVLRVTAQTDEGEVMAVEQAKMQVYGVQFHPESVLSDYGTQILGNFLSSASLIANTTAAPSHANTIPCAPSNTTAPSFAKTSSFPYPTASAEVLHMPRRITSDDL